MAPHNPIRAAAPPVDDPCTRQSNLNSLLVRVGDGDRAAFADFYDEMSQAVYGLSLGAGHGPAFSAQVTVDAFLRVWQQSGSYDPDAGSAWAWVREIAMDEIVGRGEKKRPGPRRGDRSTRGTAANRRHSYV